MTKEVVFGTMLFVCVAACAGYFIYRKIYGGTGGTKNITLSLKDVFEWIDNIYPQFQQQAEGKMEVCILPNEESRKLTKNQDRRLYVAVLQQDINGEKRVLTTKNFFADSVDNELSSLKAGNMVIIPIE